MNSINWPALNIWVFIARLVEHCSANAEATGSNLVEALKFFGLKFAIAKIAITTAMVKSSFHTLYSRPYINLLEEQDITSFLHIRRTYYIRTLKQYKHC